MGSKSRRHKKQKKNEIIDKIKSHTKRHCGKNIWKEEADHKKIKLKEKLSNGNITSATKTKHCPQIGWD